MDNQKNENPNHSNNSSGWGLFGKAVLSCLFLAFILGIFLGDGGGTEYEVITTAIFALLFFVVVAIILGLWFLGLIFRSAKSKIKEATKNEN
ncbi:hypothetical protein [Desulfovibrio litoralis]|uniref:Uncharacterized protein n=1 Tax=Desulfovibrio litoralis DSM 11393 TaxID=1121455 RepID=A0A1M7SWQ2_9BACT|nr:hypothetical protein [Desulfovibrio litoralis]SHN62808.1 hypothetical protein SAMN02745728_01304 [Desulfovibrio litoralis DSM 11393]